MAEQTAVEFLLENIHLLHSLKWNDVIEQAKQMEKEQMEQCYKEGIEDTKKVLKDELKELLVFPNPYKK